ncbi:MAG: hypothetical protein AB8B64_09210 [Granulosicoccus sp.]
MTLAIFKYGLPVLLGYTLFVGVSGRLNPFARPDYKQERASWYLGIWIGLVISVVLATGLHMAYSMPYSYASSLTVPTAFSLSGLIAPALVLYGLYRYRLARPTTLRAHSHFDWAIGDDDEVQDSFKHDTDSTQDTSVETSEKCPNENTRQSIALTSEVRPAYLAAVQIDRMNSDIRREAVNDSGAPARTSVKDSLAVETETESKLRTKLAEETALREETEKHLRITRKALSVIESETRHHSIDQADALIELEEKLAQSIDSTTTLEAAIVEEKAKRLEVEENVLALKQKMVNAKQQIRKGAAARAKALSTANKSIAFARQSVQIRAKLESKLNEAQAAIDDRQKTMSSLVRALEKEKRKTQQEIADVARQLVLNEKQRKAKRSLEEVARSVENQLTSRLVKKVAKARPLTTRPLDHRATK